MRCCFFCDAVLAAFFNDFIAGIEECGINLSWPILRLFISMLLEGGLHYSDYWEMTSKRGADVKRTIDLREIRVWSHEVDTIEPMGVFYVYNDGS
jgi:hypothetical protein